MSRQFLSRQCLFLSRQCLCLGLSLLLLSGGCEKSGQYPYVGDMEDSSYSGRRGRPYGPTADGGQLALEDFAGEFVWVEYAATWCGPCARQAPIIKKLEGELRGDVVFITVITSAQAGLGRPTATRETAKAWAERFGLQPRNVVASDLWSLTIPQHILYSPRGQTLYRKEGLHSEQQVRDVLSRATDEWKESTNL